MFQRFSVLVLLVITLFIYYFISFYINQSKKYFWIPEASILIIIGVISSFFLIAVDGIYEPVRFDTELFFQFLLPPMIFASGLDIDVKIFYNNFGSIMFFANIGTVVGAVVFGLLFYWISSYQLSNVLISLSECFVFGAILSATDPVSTISMFQKLKVDRKLYNIVLAVSTMDDGVALMMFHICAKYVNHPVMDYSEIFRSIFYFCGVIIGSMAMGYFIGALFVYMLKRTKNITGDKVRLCSLLFCVVYIANSLAFVIEFSGIITTLFAAISFKRYFEMIFGNIKAVGIYDLFIFLSQFFENIVFLHIGLTIFSDISPNNPDPTRENRGVWAFIGWTLLFNTFSRFVQVYPLSALYNLCYRNSKRNDSITTVKKEIPSLNEEEQQQQEGGGGGQRVIAMPRDIPVSSSQITNFNWSYQHILFISGVRGPIAYATALSYNFANSNYVLAATDFTIIVTVVVLGFLTYPMIFYLGIDMNCEDFDELASSDVDVDNDSVNCCSISKWSFVTNQVSKLDSLITEKFFTLPNNQHEVIATESERSH